jgi:2-polyprenyl-3-methyl-5-hydroxy-6-metoxy-1,4-benzoquinol methylase
MNVQDFVAAQLPKPPARVLEVGCGAGDLARSLAGLGYDVIAIDPDAPKGAIFRKVSLEDFSESGSFDAVVASRSLHHLPDVTVALTKIHELLRPGGLLIINEFAWNQMNEATAHWYLAHVPEPGHEHQSVLPANFPDAWIAEHEGQHDSATMQQGLDAVFDLRLFEWVPYIAEHYLERPDLITEEKKLIRSGEVNALGFRYVGRRA